MNDEYRHVFQRLLRPLHSCLNAIAKPLIPGWTLMSQSVYREIHCRDACSPHRSSSRCPQSSSRG